MLAGELLREAEKLVAAKIHPMTIISGSSLCFVFGIVGIEFPFKYDVLVSSKCM